MVDITCKYIYKQEDTALELESGVNIFISRTVYLNFNVEGRLNGNV